MNQVYPLYSYWKLFSLSLFCQLCQSWGLTLKSLLPTCLSRNRWPSCANKAWWFSTVWGLWVCLQTLSGRETKYVARLHLTQVLNWIRTHNTVILWLVLCWIILSLGLFVLSVQILWWTSGQSLCWKRSSLLGHQWRTSGWKITKYPSLCFLNAF